METGWKLHLNFRVDSGGKVPVGFTEFCSTLGVTAKVGRNSGQTGKDATVYCGSNDKAKTVALILASKYSCLFPPAGDTLEDDCLLHSLVAARFDVSGALWHQYGAWGIPFHKTDWGHLNSIRLGWVRDKAPVPYSSWKEYYYQLRWEQLKKEFGEYFTGS